jgi:phosphatidylglycerophosphate synthase
MASKGTATRQPGFFQRHANAHLYVANLIGAIFLFDASGTNALRDSLSLILDLSKTSRLVHIQAQDSTINELTYFSPYAGYFRVLCIVYAFATASHSAFNSLAVYFLAFVCDELDGRFARMLNQKSRLGAVLDMATDRVSTAGLLALLCKFAPAYSTLWVLLIVLDVSSHWFQMYSTLACNETTHKVRLASSLVPSCDLPCINCLKSE